jgi:surface protein
MNGMFSAPLFNQDISSWNVSNVTNMSFMFYFNTSFNQNISSWNVSNVTNMSSMFQSATMFNQNISSWDVSNVTNMFQMFYNASSFNNNGVKMNWTCNQSLYSNNFGNGSILYVSSYNVSGPGNAVRNNGVSSIQTPIYTPP